MYLLSTSSSWAQDRPDSAAGRVNRPAVDGTRTDTTLTFPYTSFGIRLLYTTIEQSSLDNNRILSPLGAGQALAIALLGARGSTAQAIAQTLDIGQLTAESLAVRNRRLNDQLDHRQYLVLNVANALWVDSSVTLKTGFEHTARREYGASVRVMPLASPITVTALNQWAGSATTGRVQQLLDGPLMKNVKLVIANAVYFKSTWDNPFAPQDTRDRPFTLPSGQSLVVPTMEHTDRLAYRRGKHFQAVRLPYTGLTAALYLVLPDSNQSPLTVLNKIRTTGWPFPNLDGEVRRVHLLLPKVHVAQQTDLMPPLSTLGMQAAFTFGANFTGLAEPRLYISKIDQKTTFDLDEKGTEAAAVTEMRFQNLFKVEDQRPLVNFVVDRPFFFALRDERTGTLLFVGYIART